MKEKRREFFQLLGCSRQSCRYSLVPVTVPPAGERLVKQSKIIGGGSCLTKSAKEPETDRTASRHSGLKDTERSLTPRSLAPPPFTSEFLLRRSQHVHSRIGMVYSIPNVTTHLDGLLVCHSRKSCPPPSRSSCRARVRSTP